METEAQTQSTVPMPKTKKPLWVYAVVAIMLMAVAGYFYAVKHDKDAYIAWQQQYNKSVTDYQTVLDTGKSKTKDVRSFYEMRQIMETGITDLTKVKKTLDQLPEPNLYLKSENVAKMKSAKEELSTGIGKRINLLENPVFNQSIVKKTNDDIDATIGKSKLIVDELNKQYL